MNDQKIVEFGYYCQRCKHYSKAENEDPCRECLSNPIRSQTRKPLFYEEGGRDNK